MKHKFKKETIKRNIAEDLPDSNRDIGFDYGSDYKKMINSDISCF